MQRVASRPLVKANSTPLEFMRCPLCGATGLKSDNFCNMCGVMILDRKTTERLPRGPVYLALTCLAVLLAACILYLVRY